MVGTLARSISDWLADRTVNTAKLRDVSGTGAQQLYCVRRHGARVQDPEPHSGGAARGHGRSTDIARADLRVHQRNTGE